MEKKLYFLYYIAHNQIKITSGDKNGKFKA